MGENENVTVGKEFKARVTELSQRKQFDQIANHQKLGFIICQNSENGPILSW